MYIFSTPEEVGKAFRVIYERMKNQDDPFTTPNVIKTCYWCKYNHGVEGYDQEWGRFLCIRHYCDRNKNLMDTYRSKDKYDNFECQYFEYGEGQYDKMSEKEKKILGL